MSTHPRPEVAQETTEYSARLSAAELCNGLIGTLREAANYLRDKEFDDETEAEACVKALAIDLDHVMEFCTEHHVEISASGEGVTIPALHLSEKTNDNTGTFEQSGVHEVDVFRPIQGTFAGYGVGFDKAEQYDGTSKYYPTVYVQVLLPGQVNIEFGPHVAGGVLQYAVIDLMSTPTIDIPLLNERDTLLEILREISIDDSDYENFMLMDLGLTAAREEILGVNPDIHTAIQDVAGIREAAELAAELCTTNTSVMLAHFIELRLGLTGKMFALEAVSPIFFTGTQIDAVTGLHWRVREPSEEGISKVLGKVKGVVIFNQNNVTPLPEGLLLDTPLLVVEYVSPHTGETSDNFIALQDLTQLVAIA